MQIHSVNGSLVVILNSVPSCLEGYVEQRQSCFNVDDLSSLIKKFQNRKKLYLFIVVSVGIIYIKDNILSSTCVLNVLNQIKPYTIRALCI